MSQRAVVVCSDPQMWRVYILPFCNSVCLLLTCLQGFQAMRLDYIPYLRQSLIQAMQQLQVRCCVVDIGDPERVMQ
jgi:hypothetical protein